MKLTALALLLAGAAGVACAQGAAVPAAGQGCAAGWNQLLPADGQRAESGAGHLDRDCQMSGADEHEPAGLQTAAFLRKAGQAPLTIVPPAALRMERMEPRQYGKQSARLRKSPDGQLAALRQVRSGAMPVALAPMIDHVAQAHDIDPLLLHAIARVESRHQPGAVSPAGAQGLMQVMAPTARKFGVDDARDLHDPLTNLEVSARYLKSMQLRFGNNLTLVLAAYNAGEGAVERHGRRVPPYRETQDYVRKVLAEYSLLLRVSGRQNIAAALPRANS